jgi:hypothetical protein
VINIFCLCVRDCLSVKNGFRKDAFVKYVNHTASQDLPDARLLLRSSEGVGAEVGFRGPPLNREERENPGATECAAGDHFVATMTI